MYIDRDSEGNIVSIYSRMQRDGQEFIEVEAMRLELAAQELRWDHGYA